MGTEEEQQADHQAGADRATPGQMLREARERQGISQQDIADKLFLKCRQVEDMEADRIDENMSITFAKGYVRNYAKNVGIDDKAVIREFERIHNAPKPPAKLQSFSRRVSKQANDDRWMMVTWGILLLLVAGVFAWYFQQSGDDNRVGEESPAAVTQPAEQVATPREDSTSAQIEQSSDATNEPQSLTQNTQPETNAASEDTNTATDNSYQADEPQELLADEPEDEPVASTNDTTTEPVSADIADADKVEVVFTFGEDCWVNIKDATGEAIAYGVKTAGRVMSINGVPPFDVTLGAPRQVSIVYDGASVDTSFMPQNSTARFTLPLQD